MPMKNRDVSPPKAALISTLLFVVALSAQSRSSESRSGQWRIAGQNLNNTWSQPAEHSISPANVKGLSPKWVFTTGGDVSATPPTVDGDAVYFPDWSGNLFAVNKQSGRLIWSRKISDYDGVSGAVSRVSPAVDGDQLIIGDILNSKQVHNGANVISVDRETGTRRWIPPGIGNNKVYAFTLVGERDRGDHSDNDDDHEHSDGSHDRLGTEK